MAVIFIHQSCSGFSGGPAWADEFWRRLEFEADAYAVELTQQPAVFLQALRKLIQLNDAPENLAKFDEMLATPIQPLSPDSIAYCC